MKKYFVRKNVIYNFGSGIWRADAYANKFAFANDDGKTNSRSFEV